MNIRTEDVFTPNGFPTHTYVTRNSALEPAVSYGLKMFGFVSVAGPSKSGKTVLIEKVVGPDKLITVAGGTISSSDSLWAQIISRVGGPQSTTRSDSSTQGEKINLSAKVGIGISKTGGEGSGGLALENARSQGVTNTYTHSGPEGACKLLREKGLTLLVDDFHYIAKDVQHELAKQFKEITRSTASTQRVQIIVASVPHRADDPVRANPDLRGRIGTVDLRYWEVDELRKIAEMGLATLNIEIIPRLIERLAEQAAGSPQLMQTLCYTTVAIALGVEERQRTSLRLTPKDADVESALKLAATMNDSRSLVGKLDEGKRTRGKERVMIQFRDGSSDDVYTCILRAIAIDPPTLDFEATELQVRIHSICVTPPPWGSVVRTLAHMQEIADLQQANTFVWDGEQLSITDPHVLFYLRWCGDYRRPEMRIRETVPIRRTPTGR